MKIICQEDMGYFVGRSSLGVAEQAIFWLWMSERLEDIFVISGQSASFNGAKGKESPA